MRWWPIPTLLELGANKKKEKQLPPEKPAAESTPAPQTPQKKTEKKSSEQKRATQLANLKKGWDALAKRRAAAKSASTVASTADKTATKEEPVPT